MLKMKKGEVGFSLLLLLIGSILIATLIMGLYLSTTIKFEQKAFMTTDKTKQAISNKLTITEPSSYYRSDGHIQNISTIVQLSPTSNPIDLDSVTLNIKTQDTLATLIYRGESFGPADFFTLAEESYDTTNLPKTLQDDFDGDGTKDSLILQNSFVKLSMTTDGIVTLGNCSGTGVFINNLTDTTYIQDVSGVCSGTAVSEITITPTTLNRGYYTVEYIKQGTTYINGRISKGDILKVYFELQKPLYTEKEITLTFTPKVGSPTLYMFQTPHTTKVGFVSLGHY